MSSPRSGSAAPRSRVGDDRHPDQDGEDEQGDRDQPGDQGGGEHGDDVRLHDDGVDDQDHRRRDQDAEHPAGGDGAGAQGVGVPVALELGERDPPHRRRGRERAAAHGAEPGAGGDGRHRDAAAQPAQPGVRRPEEVRAEAAARRDRPHQHEQRHHRQVVYGELAVGEVLELAEDDLRSAQDRDPGPAHHDHGVGDGYPDRDQRNQRAQSEQADGDGLHAQPGFVRARSPNASTSVMTDASTMSASETSAGTKAHQMGISRMPVNCSYSR